MRKILSAICILFLSISASAQTAGWVYMGYYPFMYNGDTAKWSYSTSPVIWHQDIFNGGWYFIGNQPPNLTPENLYGRTIQVWSAVERIYYDLGFSSFEQFYGAASVGGNSLGFYYVYKKITNNQAQILAFDGSQMYDYSLVFETTNSGIWEGYTINNNGVFAYYGTFILR